MHFASLLVLHVALAAGSVNGALFANTFSDDMILQRAPQKSAVYGLLGNDTAVTVSLVQDGTNQTVDVKKAAVDLKDGTWKVVFDPISDSKGTYNVLLETTPPTSRNVLKRVRFGDVYVCAGQSNMALALEHTFNLGTILNDLGSVEDMLRALDFVGMDDMKFAAQAPVFVNSRLPPKSTKWFTPSKNKALVKGFSATCFYFGYQLVKHLKQKGIHVPIGLIHGAIGGTNIEAWVDNSTTKTCRFTELDVPKQRVLPGSLYNGVISPLVNTTITGWLWYQGENNVGGNPGAQGYGCQIKKLIQKWRSDWSTVPGTTDPNAYFAVVTLAGGTGEGHDDQMAEFRNSQMAPLKNVFMAHAYDLADPWYKFPECKKTGCCPKNWNPAFVPESYCTKMKPSWNHTIDGDWFADKVSFYMGPIHPRTKRRLGDRLALITLGQKYTNQNIMSPKFKSITINNGTASVKFDVGDDKLGLVSTGVRSIALKACVGNETVCKCRTWKATKASASWFCTNPAWPALNEGPLGWMPGPNNFLKHWKVIDEVNVLDNRFEFKAPDDMFSVAFAWETLPCCDHTKIDNGRTPCPPASCKMYTKMYGLPIDPFFVEVPPPGRISPLSELA
mmetsp:Transcript_31366/g.50287  ORF Transcript_31366/g.50287 Transcript_31366/m.50287 type:complete len:616 (+) Transcript_31366:184-2031(+)